MKQREIKFRGKSIKTDKWIYGTYIQSEREHFIFMKELLAHTFINRFKSIYKKSLGEYTGLKDKKGNEIYEGDILKSGTETHDPQKSYAVVYYCENKAQFLQRGQFKTGGGWSGDLNTWENYLNNITELSHWEVIGNIHDNPELLKY